LQKQKKKTAPKRVIQTHHLGRDPEITVRITKGEHNVLTKINWYTKKFVSKGFVKALKHWLALNEDRAEDV